MFLISINSINGIAQQLNTPIIDSLQTVVKNPSSNKELISALLSLSKQRELIDSIKVKSIEKALTLAKEIKNDSLIVSAKIHQAFNLVENGNSYSSQTIIEELLKHIEKYSPIQKEEIHALYARNFLHFGEYEKALKHYLIAKKIAIELKDSEEVHNLSLGIGRVYEEQGFYSEALKLYNNALYDTISRVSKGMKAAIFTNIGNLYYHTKEYDKAKNYWKDSVLNVFPTIVKEDPLSVSINFHNLSYYFEKKGLLDSAILYENNSLKLRKDGNNFFLLSSNYLRLGELQLLKKEPHLALESFNKGLFYGTEAGYKRDISNYKLALSECYEMLGDYKNAYNTQKEHMKLYKELKSESKVKEITELKNEFDFNHERELKDEQIKQAQLENEIATTKNRNLWFGTLFLILFLMVISYFFFQNRKSKQKIASQNNALEKSVGEKELLLKEIHHRVKNNLQLISSLLDLQSKKIKDEKVQSVFEEGQSRVEAMSLIHQKLYQGTDLAVINFEDYLNELIGYFSTINENGKKAVFETSCKGFEFDIDTAVPLSLIVNELITNSYKHAFNGVERPNISISIEEQEKGVFALTYQDNGKGLPENFDWKRATTLGLRLINSLAKQMFGKVGYHNTENYSVFNIYFRNEFGRRNFE